MGRRGHRGRLQGPGHHIAYVYGHADPRDAGIANALAGFLLGAAAWWQTGKPAFLAGALLMLANWPWTLFAIMPTNKILMATDPAKAGAKTRALIVKWNKLHLVRTVLGGLAVVFFLFAVSAG